MVRVRRAEEISRTLDEEGKLDGLPFMPEMLAYCGRAMPVFKRADKTCDGRGGARRMDDAVHRVGVRCDGSAHGGCQAACLHLLEGSVLERASMNGVAPSVGANATAAVADSSNSAAVVTSDRLLPVAATTKPVDGDEVVYQCQATEVLNATRPLPLWEPQQYVQVVRNWGVRKLVRNLTISGFNKLQHFSRRFLPAWLRVRGGQRYPALSGRLTKIPKETLGLQPGELVRVKRKEEILATRDTQNRNRGLMFDVEMLRYCGKTARVKQRIDRIIDEHTGKMIEINSDCVTLEGFVCMADYHRLCTRSVYEYFREIWLERV
jgi:hypothetical protein